MEDALEEFLLAPSENREPAVTNPRAKEPNSDYHTLFDFQEMAQVEKKYRKLLGPRASEMTLWDQAYIAYLLVFKMEDAAEQADKAVALRDQHLQKKFKEVT